ncbi:MAG: cyclase family protein [Pyrinomonadaceae bacterium]|nr:cyclase family protein [Pyrinomonadaceae bacterium]
MIKKSLFLVVAALTFIACSQPATDPLAGTWVDLTHDFAEDTVYWVTAEPFKRTTVAEGQTDKGFYYAAYNFSGAEHGGTHLDSPIHFAENKKTADQIEISELIGSGVKIDVSEKASADRDYLISIGDITTWEAANGTIADASIVLFSTGFAKRWPDLNTYLGTDRKGPDAVKDLHFPGLHPDAAKWLVANRKIKAVGIDTASIDYGQSTLFESHVALMTNNIPAFENVSDMSRLPTKGFHVFAFPMKIKGGSGGPLRIAALIRNNGN